MDRPTSLILGGSDKGCLFDDIFKVEPNLITNYILMGQTRAKLYQTAMQWGKKNVYLCDDLSCAVELAYKLSSSGNNVLFSPACASYDMFSNYEERGKCFCGIVRGLKKSEDNRLDDNQKTKV
jgi:UDP-N-acetylmuramoylalanine--D-glutamate ligase